MLFPCLLQLLSAFLTPDKDFKAITDRLNNTVWEIYRDCIEDTCNSGGEICKFGILDANEKQGLEVRYREYNNIIDPIDGEKSWRVNICTPTFFIISDIPINGEYPMIYYSEGVGKANGTFKFASDTEFVLTYSNSRNYRSHYKLSQLPADLKKIIGDK